MFTQKKQERFAKLLGLTPQEFETYIHRYRGHLNTVLQNKSLSFNQVMHGFVFFEDIIKNRENKDPETVIKFGSIRSMEIKKYGVEVLELNLQGYGAKRICDAMKIGHNVDISKSTMDRFLRLNQKEL